MRGGNAHAFIAFQIADGGDRQRDVHSSGQRIAAGQNADGGGADFGERGRRGAELNDGAGDANPVAHGNRRGRLKYEHTFRCQRISIGIGVGFLNKEAAEFAHALKRTGDDGLNRHRLADQWARGATTLHFVNAVADCPERNAVRAECLEARLAQILANGCVGIPDGVARISHHLNGGGGTGIGRHFNNALRAAGGRQTGERGGGHAWRVGHIAGPAIQAEIAWRGADRAVVWPGDDDVATGAGAFYGAYAAATEIKLDRRAKRGRARCR